MKTIWLLLLLSFTRFSYSQKQEIEIIVVVGKVISFQLDSLALKARKEND